MSKTTRIFDRVRELRGVFTEREIRLAAAVFVLLCATLGTVAIVFPDRFTTIALNSLISVLFTLITVLLGYDLILRYGRGSERDRVLDDDSVVDEYGDRCELLDRSVLPEWDRRFGTRQSALLPFVPEYVPDRPRSVSSFGEVVHQDAYSLPDQLQLLLDPVSEKQRDRFLSEGHYNALKAGLMEINDGTFHFRPESYFQSFRTTHSPDLEIYDSRTLRDLADHMLFTEDESLRSLGDTPFPTAFGGGGIVISRDGRCVVPIRSSEVMYATGSAEVSFGGSFDFETITNEDMTQQYLQELDEELSISSENVVDVYCLGVIRRLELLGSPDTLVLVIVDEETEFENPSKENVRLLRTDVLPEQQDVDLSSLLTEEAASQVVRQLFARLDSEGYPPGSALSVTLLLLLHHAGPRDLLV